MAKPEWGEKHRCSSCSKPFYDMNRTPIICPSCGAENKPERLLKPRKTSEAPAKEAPKKKVEAEDDDVDLGNDDLLDDDEDIDLPDDDDDDSDDLDGVVKHTPKDEDL